MKIEQIYTGCLAQGAYYIVSGNEAAIIDPLREIKPYLQRAEKDRVQIKYIFETHFHADFVSGHLDLARATGAPIIYGPTAKPGFEAKIAHDNEIFQLGDVKIKVLHTPGHTMESSCFLLIDAEGKDAALFSGDTVFIGDVGRPDLAQKAANLTREELAGLLYDSLRNKILTLNDAIILYPGHGAGSACGKNMSDETVDTLGHQKKFNYALRPHMTRNEFIYEVTEGLTPPPGYFPFNVKMNKEGYDEIDVVIQNGAIPLETEAFLAITQDTNALIIDTRKPEIFVEGFIPGSINIGIDGSFAPWVGALVSDIYQPILLITEPGREEEVIIRLARVGYENVMGYLAGGYETWHFEGREIESIPSLSANEFKNRYNLHPYPVIDVRRHAEYEKSHIEGATNIPLDFINDNMDLFPTDKPFYIHCAGGYRSVVAASILKARGFNSIINVLGGFDAIKKTDVKVI